MDSVFFLRNMNVLWDFDGIENTVHCHSSLIAGSSKYWYSRGKKSPDSQTPVTELRSVAAKQKSSSAQKIVMTPKNSRIWLQDLYK